MTTMMFLIIGIVVKITMMENKYVQIGSAYHMLGKKYIKMAAIITPMLIKTSPRTCTKAASTLMLDPLCSWS